MKVLKLWGNIKTWKVGITTIKITDRDLRQPIINSSLITQPTDGDGARAHYQVMKPSRAVAEPKI